MSMSIIGAVVGIGVAGYGVYQKGRANKKAKDALARRKEFQTPDEVYQILNAMENRSQGDTATRDFQTQQIDNSFAQQLGVAELLGADPNDLSGMFNQKMQGILQVGQQFHASNMEAFGKYIGGLDMLASNKAAEWKSGQDFVKDDLQAAAADGAAANATINSGINTALAGYSAHQSNKLYKEYLQTVNNGGATAASTQYPITQTFQNSTITDAIPPPAAPQRTTGTGLQTIVAPSSGQTVTQAAGLGDYTNDAGFLQWLQNKGIGTKR